MHRSLALVACACVFTGFALAAERHSAADEPVARPLVVGHRGLLQAAPENTLAGYRACLALRVGFEFDVRRTKDGELVCIHDATVDRTTSGSGRVDRLTFAELSQLDAGGWYDAAFKNERVPRIDDILRLVAEQRTDSTLVAVDIKDTGNGLEDRLLELAQKHGVLNRLIFIGATIDSADVRTRLHSVNPAASLARLAKEPSEIDVVLGDETADWVYVRFFPTPADAQRIHRAGKRIFIAGPLTAAESPENWRKAQQLGIDGILTDYPLELQRMLRGGGK